MNEITSDRATDAGTFRESSEQTEASDWLKIRNQSSVSMDEESDSLLHDEDYFDRRDLSPILEEDEETNCSSEKASHARVTILSSGDTPRCASYDSLLSFEANEKLLSLWLPEESLQVGEKVVAQRNRGGQNCLGTDSGPPSRPSSACRPLSFTPDFTRCYEWSDTESVGESECSRPCSAGSSVKRTIKRMGSGSFDLEVWEEEDECDLAVFMKSDVDNSCSESDPLANDESSLAEQHVIHMKSNYATWCAPPAENHPISCPRSLLLDHLLPNTSHSEKPIENETVVDHGRANEDDLMGYSFEKVPENSLIDLQSLHEMVVENVEKNIGISGEKITGNGKDVAQLFHNISDIRLPSNVKEEISDCMTGPEVRGEKSLLINDRSSTDILQLDRNSAHVTGDVDETEAQAGQQTSGNVSDLPGILVTEIRGGSDDETLTDGASENSCPALILFPPNHQLRAKVDGEFFSCVGSNRTTPTDLISPFDRTTEGGYATPPENTETSLSEDLKYFETRSVASNDAECNDSFYSVCSYKPSNTTDTETPSGFQTPPRFCYVIPPKFLGKKNIEIKVNQGGSAVLSCSVVSHPEAKVAWYKDGRLLEIYDRISQHITNSLPMDVAFGRELAAITQTSPLLETNLERDIGCRKQLDVHYVLRINHIVARDEGLYTCKAWNTIGIASKTIQLIVTNKY